MDIRDFFDVSLLEEVMTEWSKATGMATIAMDDKNEYLTKSIGFTDFCTKHTRGSAEGLRRCIRTDACNSGVYYCHAGLMDFSIDICLEDGTYLGKVIGGQILSKEPDISKFRKLAVELGIDPDEYVDALSRIEIRSESAIQASAYLLGRIVNLLVNSEYVKKRQETVIRNMDEKSRLDSMTGIYNKSFLNDVLKSKIRTGNSFSLIMIDLDDFKGINDSLGHMAGDAVIKMFANELRSIFRSTDIVGRFGGDEFCVIMDEEDRSKLEQYGKRICSAAKRVRIPEIGREITASAGIALYSGRDADASAILENADRALYEAKKNGRNQYIIYAGNR